ncbi:MAG TPA: 50S ribosomal protein L11 methyltransferase, partial [Bacillota bacterium]|nr:50S ribosomal protein L11 methyltransferase [Bacillota bacterium]
VKISDNIWIKPTWESIETNVEDPLVIELDPGMAFGTGTHPTTKLCVQALEKFVKQDDTVLDVGCGSGVLSIAAALLGADSVYAFDLDDVAVSSTRNNTNVNKMEDVIKVKQNNLLEGITEKADVIVSNILAEIIITFTQDVWECLKEEGYFIASGIISEKKELVVSNLHESGFKIVHTDLKDDWIVIVAQKRNI